MDSSFIDWFLVVVATIVNWLMKRLWYSPWMYGTFHTSIPKKKKMILWGSDLAFSFLMAYAFAFLHVLLKITSINDGIFLAWIIWGAFLLPTYFFDFFSGQKQNSQIFIDLVFSFLSLTCISGIIGA